jgi:hypothetical protein
MQFASNSNNTGVPATMDSKEDDIALKKYNTKLIKKCYRNVVKAD